MYRLYSSVSYLNWFNSWMLEIEYKEFDIIEFADFLFFYRVL